MRLSNTAPIVLEQSRQNKNICPNIVQPQATRRKGKVPEIGVKWAQIEHTGTSHVHHHQAFFPAANRRPFAPL